MEKVTTQKVSKQCYERYQTVTKRLEPSRPLVRLKGETEKERETKVSKTDKTDTLTLWEVAPHEMTTPRRFFLCESAEVALEATGHTMETASVRVAVAR